eukprot:364595-Chlamydomonas_euryale.AAC.16
MRSPDDAMLQPRHPHRARVGVQDKVVAHGRQLRCRRLRADLTTSSGGGAGSGCVRCARAPSQVGTAGVGCRQHTAATALLITWTAGMHACLHAYIHAWKCHAAERGMCSPASASLPGAPPRHGAPRSRSTGAPPPAPRHRRSRQAPAVPSPKRRCRHRSRPGRPGKLCRRWHLLRSCRGWCRPRRCSWRHAAARRLSATTAAAAEDGAKVARLKRAARAPGLRACHLLASGLQR